MTKMVVEEKKLVLTDDIEGFVMKRVTKFGNSGKVDVPRRYIGRMVYLVICREEKA